MWMWNISSFHQSILHWCYYYCHIFPWVSALHLSQVNNTAGIWFLKHTLFSSGSSYANEPLCVPSDWSLRGVSPLWLTAEPGMCFWYRMHSGVVAHVCMHLMNVLIRFNPVCSVNKDWECLGSMKDYDALILSIISLNMRIYGFNLSCRVQMHDFLP